MYTNYDIEYGWPTDSMDTYDTSSDEEALLEEYIERGREEYRRAWLIYVGEFEEAFFKAYQGN